MRKESQAEHRGCKLNAAHSRNARYTSRRHAARSPLLRTSDRRGT